MSARAEGRTQENTMTTATRAKRMHAQKPPPVQESRAAAELRLITERNRAVVADKKASIAFLRAAGILNAAGKLAKAFR